MNELIVLRVVVRFMVPFIFMYGLYVQFHGDYSAGGGFQAGVICAAAFIVHSLVHGLSDTMRVLPLWVVRTGSAVGVLIYGGVGIISMLRGGMFLGYSELLHDPRHGQHLGIILVEIGVGVTVFSVMMLIFYVFGERSD